jgi:hypothetical protein
LKGRILVVKNSAADYPNYGKLIAVDQVEKDDPMAEFDQLQTVWKDGKFIKRYTFEEVRKNAQV